MTSLSNEGIGWLATGMAATIALLCLGWWFSTDPTTGLMLHVPGMDLPDGFVAGQEEVEQITIGELFAEYDGKAAALPGSWPRFRGARSDNIAITRSRLADSWHEDGPEVLWSLQLGEGHAAPAVHNGRVYLLDYDEESRADALRCFSLADGREIWRRSYRVKIKRNHGLSRTIPAVTDRFAVTIGPRGHVMAVDAVSGDLLWGIDLEQEYGTTVPFWYTGQCPLIDDGVAIIAPAGSALLIGVDCSNGEVLWQAPNPFDWQMSHTSVMPVTLGGKRMYVYSAIGGLVGVSAEEEDRGTVLWKSDLWTQSVLAPSPLALPGDRLFVTAGYGAGSMVLQVVQDGGSFRVDKLQEYKPTQGLASEQQTPLLLDGHLIGIQPKDAGELREQLVCYAADDPTGLVWSSGKTVRFGLGPYLFVREPRGAGKLLVLNDDGTLTMAEVSSAGYRQLAQAKILDGVDAWGPLVLVGNRLLLRDATRLVCLDLGLSGSA